MGALHEGHLSLVREAKRENDYVVASIFVNPTQFNNLEDLNLYPRNEVRDFDLLQSEKCSIVFFPDVNEMYPEKDTREFDFNGLDTEMEGKFRPGHFNGVAQIVTKLFDLVIPDKVYFGKKDYQQMTIIKYIIKKLNYPIKLVSVDTVREPDGLAMSSRNLRLTKEQRQLAPKIYQTLLIAKEMAKTSSIETVQNFVADTLNKTPFMKVEYFNIVDSNTLKIIENWNDTDSKVGCIAVYCGDIRLIDNIEF